MLSLSFLKKLFFAKKNETTLDLNLKGVHQVSVVLEMKCIF